ncbi:MAG: extracellular solute-binding protein [Chloroflexi bacterium]|nr:extracellular solute-binding protein [Chloroflexota bacterium]
MTVAWWHINTVDDQKALWQKLANDYMAAHPNVDIQITVLENENFKTKLTTVMQSGSPPDLFQSWGGGVMNEYAQAGLLKDITADLQGGWGDTFGKGALAVYSYQGKYYGVPRDMGMVGFWYNKDLFAKAGIQAPPATWTDFLADVKKLKDAGITPIALGEKDKWPGAFWWEYLAVRLGGKNAFDAAYSRKGAFTDQPFVDAGKTLQALTALQPFQDGYLGAIQNDEAALVGNGKAAMELMGQWAPGVENDNSVDKKGLGDKLGFFPFPSVEGGKGNATDALGGGNGFTVGKNAPKEAVDFLKFISSPDAQRAQAKIGMSVPVVKGAEDALTDPLLKIVQQNAANAPYFQLYYDQYMPPAVGSVINDSVQELFAGTMDPMQAAKAIDDSAAKELK